MLIPQIFVLTLLDIVCIFGIETQRDLSLAHWLQLHQLGQAAFLDFVDHSFTCVRM